MNIVAQDLIGNGNFEDGNFGWNFTSGGSSVVGEEEVIIRNKYCKIDQTEAIYQPVPLSSGKTYTISFNTRSSLGGTLSVMKQNTNDTYWSIKIYPAPGTEWQSETHPFRVETNWEGPLVIHFRAAPGSPDRFLEIDNVSLLEGTNPRSIAAAPPATTTTTTITTTVTITTT
jgi:hypothetical protein